MYKNKRKVKANQDKWIYTFICIYVLMYMVIYVYIVIYEDLCT